MTFTVSWAVRPTPDSVTEPGAAAQKGTAVPKAAAPIAQAAGFDFGTLAAPATGSAPPTPSLTAKLATAPATAKPAAAAPSAQPKASQPPVPTLAQVRRALRVLVDGLLIGCFD